MGLSMAVVRITKCGGCGNRIDPDLCHCGDSLESHKGGMSQNHGFVPMGCTCGYVKGGKLIRKSAYSPYVAKRLDPARPRYSNAVKSIGAFARSQEEFDVLVTHLDDACREAVHVFNRDRLKSSA
jgi:hypothetical protein